MTATPVTEGGFRWSLLAVAPFKPLGVRKNDVLTVDVAPGRATLFINGADPRPLVPESFWSTSGLARGLEAGALVPLTMMEQDDRLGQARCRAMSRSLLRLVR